MKIVVLFFCVLTSLFSHQTIESIHSLPQVDRGGLIVFDIDEVLITTEDQILLPSSDEVFLSCVEEAFKGAKNEKERSLIVDRLSLLFLLPKRRLIEESSPAFVKALRKQSVKVIALTSCYTGRVGVVESVERWRIDHLNQLGFSFASSFPQCKRIEFTDIAQPKKTPPLYEDGVLFSKGYSKGEVLQVFLDEVSFTPSEIIFIDDLECNLDSVEQVAKEMNIPFRGFHFTGAKRFAKPLNKKRMIFQLNHLMETGEWLPDCVF